MSEACWAALKKGIGTLDEFLALLGGRTKTALFAGPYIRPLGILSLNFIEGDVRTITNVPITAWLDFMKAHPGLMRYLKGRRVLRLRPRLP